jgi:glycosyltransferase involved in cell wall biosynthesis
MGGVQFVSNLLRSLALLKQTHGIRLTFFRPEDVPDEVYNDLRAVADEYVTYARPTLFEAADRLGVDVLFPVFRPPKEASGPAAIYWIPDFQHCHLPHFFDRSENEERDRRFRAVAEADGLVVVSSHAARNDLQKHFGRSDHARVVHFHTFPVDRASSMELRAKCTAYGLDRPFAMVCNQYWPHKNHQVVLTAWSMLDKGVNQPDLVLTGDATHPSCRAVGERIGVQIESLNGQFRVHQLGLIPRADQLALMQAAAYIIQPSLFEGWSTVVEDARMLGKRVVLSDIDVHKEQAFEKCDFFSATDPRQLASLLTQCHQIPSDSGTEDCTEPARALNRKYAEDMFNVARESLAKKRSCVGARTF